MIAGQVDTALEVNSLFKQRGAGILIRDAQESDAGDIARFHVEFCNHASLHGSTAALSPAEILSQLIRSHARGLPFLVAEVEETGRMLGFGYIVQFQEQPIFAWSCEPIIRLAPDHRMADAGLSLLEALIEEARANGFHQMVTAIVEKPSSTRIIHDQLGFYEAGRFERAGCLHGDWFDLIYLQKSLTTSISM